MKAREFLWTYWNLLKEANDTKMSLMDYFSENYGLTQLQLLVLGKIDSLDDTSIRSIARSLHRDHGNISKICTVLERKGYVYRERSVTDSRIVHVYLTEQGEKYIDEFSSIVAPLYDKLGDHLTDGDLRFLLKSMEIIESLFNQSEKVRNIQDEQRLARKEEQRLAKLK
ncbi:transcriptional regulator, MarR family [Aedoeadaptatus coxii]|uniref:HTH-type transcriptional regulator SarZ n=1 Tax=Aedoeadaptatus coxii TaxID=755172 RepID=A0A134ALI0_9FIRM|nr:MarR family transcriptional regulator [Peptoniphilus coxii]KXB68578.1 transcriptional regulator, MarR family [Peptoniphilus coxii]CAC9932752.1 transcriptional regulator, MarR family [Peptoniphilus coxii]